MTHPLTDEVCDSIAPWAVKHPGGYDCMRTAAEWQLIQVLEWGYKHLYPDQVNALREAMRPQEDNHD